MSHVLIYQCLKKLVQMACRVRIFTKMCLSILVEIKNRVLTLLVSPWTWSTCQNRGVSGLPALISWWLKYFIVTHADCRATWSSRIGTMDSQSFPVTLQKQSVCVCVTAVCHSQPAAWHREESSSSAVQRGCSAKESLWGQWWHGLSSRAFACPNYFNHCRLIYFPDSANKTAVGQYWFLFKSINALSLLN